MITKSELPAIPCSFPLARPRKLPPYALSSPGSHHAVPRRHCDADALALTLDPTPRVAAHNDFAAADIDRAVAIAKQNDPRLAFPELPRSVPLAQRDIDLPLDHAA